MASLVISILIIGYLFSAYNTRVILMAKALFAIKNNSAFAREEQSITHPASILLSLNFILNVALFAILLLTAKHVVAFVSTKNEILFLMIAGLVLLIYFFKAITIKILGTIFYSNSESKEYVHIVFLTNQMVGILFVPINIFLAYGNQLWASSMYKTGGVLLIVGFILRIVRGATLVLTNTKGQQVYLFIYLCTIEILPLLLAFKLFENTI
ncbi:MAG TPA: DUF4271 domain-containing protein [Bacteroidia bacterium]